MEHHTCQISKALVPTSIKTSLSALWRNRMRSALTALGIVIGVSAVIAMVEISQGSRTGVLKTMSTMGADNLMVQSGAYPVEASTLRVPAARR